MDVELDCGFRFANTDVAVGTGWVKDTWNQQLLPEVGYLVQEDLRKRQTKKNMRWEKKQQSWQTDISK